MGVAYTPVNVGSGIIMVLIIDIMAMNLLPLSAYNYMTMIITGISLVVSFVRSMTRAPLLDITYLTALFLLHTIAIHNPYSEATLFFLLSSAHGLIVCSSISQWWSPSIIRTWLRPYHTVLFIVPWIISSFGMLLSSGWMAYIGWITRIILLRWQHLKDIEHGSRLVHDRP
jgi:hypothetical protein